MGDFNLNITKNYSRKDYFDILVTNNNLCIKENEFQTLDHSYFFKKKESRSTNEIIYYTTIKSTIDYMMASKNNSNFINVKRYCDSKNQSDHHPTLIQYNMNASPNFKNTFCKKKKQFIGWKNNTTIQQ